MRGPPPHGGGPPRGYGIMCLMPLDRRRATDALLLVTAVVAVSTSAPLVREAAAPSLTIALWRTTLGATATAPIALRQRAPLTKRELRLIVAAGVVLGAHFATWISSLSKCAPSTTP